MAAPTTSAARVCCGSSTASRTGSSSPRTSRTQIEAIIDAHRTATQGLRDQAAAARAEFRENHDLGDFDEVEYRTFFEAQAEIQVDSTSTAPAPPPQAWNILTPDQQQELLEILELFRDGRGGPRHGGGKRVGQN